MEQCGTCKKSWDRTKADQKPSGGVHVFHQHACMASPENLLYHGPCMQNGYNYFSSKTEPGSGSKNSLHIKHDSNGERERVPTWLPHIAN
ncbi:hypothetical protein ACFX10_035622 [Malus domestica]